MHDRPARRFPLALGRQGVDEAAWWMFAAGAAIASLLILWFGRDTTYSVDEVAWFSTSSGLDLSDAISPHGGHLIVTSRLVYKAILELVGADYESFRILTTLTVVLTATLFFAYASRRVGRLVALPPAILLLVFGSDSVHILVGNGFTVLLAVSCGLGALLALDRRDRRGDLTAALLLCLGVATYTVALAFVVGVAVRVLLEREPRRLWIVGIPVGLYAIWWLWASGQPDSSDNQLVLSNVLLIPTWAFQALGTVLAALTGLGYDFSSDSASQAGAALALIAVAAVGWRLIQGNVAPALWAALAVAVTLWAMQAIAPTVFRTPETSRYLYPATVAVLLVAIEALAGMRWSGVALTGLCLAATVGLATNIIELRNSGNDYRNLYTPQVRTDLGAIEVADGNADPNFTPSQISGTQSALSLPFGTLAARGDPPTGTYLAAAGRYGGLGFSPDEIRAQGEEIRARVDTVLVSALGVGLRPAGRRATGTDCRTERAGSLGSVVFKLPRDGASLVSPDAAAPVQIRRFADQTAVGIGTLQPDEPATLAVPADAAPDPWYVSVQAPELRLCTP